MFASTLKTHKEYLEDLDKALMDRGKFEAKLTQLQEDKIKWLKAALLAKWFTEDRYDKWSNYFATKASICRLKREISNNNRKIASLESRLAAFGVPASESEDDCVKTVDAEVVPDDDEDDDVTYFQNDGLNAGFEDAD